jgi:hypothetical protein
VILPRGLNGKAGLQEARYTPGHGVPLRRCCSSSNRRSIVRKSVKATLLGVVLLLLAPQALGAQPLVRVVGQIQWIAADRMQMVTEGGESIAVDLTEADQSSYRGLRNGDWVVIDGVISSDRRRIIAQEIWRDSGRGYWSQSP